MLPLIVILTLLTLAANSYFILCITAAYGFFNHAPRHKTSAVRPVTILIPARGADFQAYENLASFCKQEYAEFQIICGVLDATDSMLPVVNRVNADFPERQVEVSVCSDIIGKNLKVSNLQNMLKLAKHEHIIVVDSDIRVGKDYLSSIMSEFESPNVGLVTCLYRANVAPDFAAKMEAIGVTAEFAPGVLVGRMLDGMKFALGATMATTQTMLRRIGGFAAIADYLADDFMLGNLISAAGYEVRLSRYTVETMLAPGSFASMVRHQLRWARGTRVCRPLGYLGMIMTYGTTLACLTVLASHGNSFSLSLLGFTLSVRLLMGCLIAIHYLRDAIAKKYWWLIPIRDLLSFGIWVMSLAGRNVEWRGQQFRLANDGKLIAAS